jgi:hypothetical protein
MAIYYVSESENDNWDRHPDRRFKYRNHSTDGAPTAQELFDRLRSDGKFVRLVRWANNEWEEIDRANEMRGTSKNER